MTKRLNVNVITAPSATSLCGLAVNTVIASDVERRHPNSMLRGYASFEKNSSDSNAHTPLARLTASLIAAASSVEY